MYKPIVLQENGKIIFYKRLCKTEEIMAISGYLKTISKQIKVEELFEIYQLEEYSLINLVLDGSYNKEILIKFINDNSEYPFPKELLDKIDNIESNIKEVKLELGEGAVLLQIIRGDSNFIKQLLKDNKYIEKTSNEIYRFDNNNLPQIFNKLNENNVIIRLPKCNVTSLIDININTNINKIEKRYYQEQAFNFIKDKCYATLIMPIFAGKNYVALKLISYVKKKTLIFCYGKEQIERWKDQLIDLLGISDERISIYDSENFVTNDFIICNYEHISKNRKMIDKIVDSEWGIIIYDDAHKAVTNKVTDILLIKSERKIALASSLDRNDGKENKLFRVFGEAIYNITNNELIHNLYQKKLEYYPVSPEKSKESIIREKLLAYKDKSIIIVAHEVKDVESIARSLGIDFLNKNTDENDRDEIINKFNNGYIKVVCCSNLIEKYRFTNTDVMIAAGYRGKSKIEENFRIGTLISTTNELDQIQKALIIYLYSDETEEKIVSKKIEYIKSWGLV